MKKQLALAFAATAALLIALHLPSLVASTNGTQTFEFLGRSGSALWIAEDIGGEYCLSRLHHLVIEDGRAAAGTSELKEYGNWQPVRDLVTRLRLEKAVPLKKRPDGSLASGDLTLTAPPADPAQMESFHDHIRTGGSNALTWADQTGGPAIHPPLINGRPAQILYSLPAGLYISYTLDQAWFFPRTSQILLFTHQPTPAVGLDTMHGLLLLTVPTENPS